MNQRPDMEDMRQGFQDRRPVYWLIRARMVKTAETVESALAAHPNLRMVYMANPSVPACAEVLRSRGLAEKVHILSHDCGPEIQELLKSGDVITQSALTERLDIQPGSASEVLAKLEAAGLIQRTANDKDRRTINISLTEEGRIAAQEAYAKRDKVRHELMSNLNETEQEELLKLLEKLTADYSARYPKKSRTNA